jgi:Acetyltransferase (GNAT) domain
MCPEASFFVSREWVGEWLETFGAELNPELVTFEKDGDVVGCTLLVWRTERVRGIPLRRVYLNCTGENESDSTCIEFNALVCLPECNDSVAQALVSYLKSRRWDELLISGAVEQEAIGRVTELIGNYEVSETPSRFVDFAVLRKKRGDYLGSLSSKNRYHIRRTRRAFEELGGEITTRMAQTSQEALDMLRELADLHQARRQALGDAGSFSSQKFTRFHENLIRKHFDRTMLFRVAAGDKSVGLLLCFLHRGWVYYYQSGFSYSLDSRRNPGQLTLYCVIDACLAREDLQGFDFMAGDVEYKRSLTGENDFKPLRWYIVRRRTLPSLLYLFLRGLKRKYARSVPKSGEAVQQPGGTESGEDVPVQAGETQ